ncbi:dihydrodipicolinate synthase family protein [Arenibacter algicola]|uniref:Putative 2-keto-3-deoxy-galactonate aldolase YagE n=1 Tax=Arenibacter algicola TaxID=616991 RepID=A0A221UQU5_9FLAO|nr:dihydrodipicolinate synthase family protein [Arenibacter algicola]ASO03640.1 putative 2-keto-3-deoxy-galactonate aldolase YagE [Arenibacter algicola]|tara:strand:+ start:455 stop:1378 length:924 start_codon:yes stop_codon:yes gene_type:complete
MKLAIKGIIPPMVTPLLENKELDLVGLKNLLEHLINGGVHGIFILGTTGEGPSLSYAVRKQLVSETCRIVNKKVPVLVGITDTSFDGTLEIANHAKKVGADALVVAPPYYFPIAQEEMGDYLESLVPMLPLPFMLYNMPSCTKLHLSIDVVRRAKELGAIGIKDSSGDLSYLYVLIEEFKSDPTFSIIAGTELFLPETIMYGGHGSVAGGANFFPRLFVDLYEAAMAQNLEKVKLLRDKVIKVHQTIYEVGEYPSRHIKGTKAALMAMGICQDHNAEPLDRFTEEQRNRIKKYIAQFNYRNEYKTIH